ncbi:MAG: IS630 family transposase [Bacteroidota bacterium]
MFIGAQDERRFGRISIPKSCWCAKPERPQLAKKQRRQTVYAYTAVCPKLAKTTSLILPYANTDMFNIFLEQLGKDFKAYKLIIQVDQAGWHKSRVLKIPNNIALIEQPSRSPELNPVEHIWEEVRETFLNNKIHHSIEELIDQLAFGLNTIANYGEKLTSMTMFNHLNVAI